MKDMTKVKAIAERMAKAWAAQLKGWTPGEYLTYQAACATFLPHILSLMARAAHNEYCAGMMMRNADKSWTFTGCNCGLDAELKSIESLIHQTT